MGSRLKDKVAVITGSSMGIGKEIALLMAEEGANLVLTARNIEPLNQVVKEAENLGGRAVAFTGDVSIKEQAESMVNAAAALFSRLANTSGDDVTLVAAAGQIVLQVTPYLPISRAME